MKGNKFEVGDIITPSPILLGDDPFTPANEYVVRGATYRVIHVHTTGNHMEIEPKPNEYSWDNNTKWWRLVEVDSLIDLYYSSRK